METKTSNSFKAVDFMRRVREDLATMYHTDKERYHKELKKAMDDFIARRAATSGKKA